MMDGNRCLPGRQNGNDFEFPIHKHLILDGQPSDIEKTPIRQLESAPKSVSYSNLY